MTETHALFITGTGTDVGKTFVAALLARGLRTAGHGVTYWKPVESGPQGADADVVRRQAGDGCLIAPTAFSYPLPASPDQAAHAAQRSSPYVSGLLTALDELRTGRGPTERLLVEGAGGLLVPLNEDAETWADLLHAARLATLVVASPALGTLNHTALTLRHLEARGVPILGVVLSGPRHQANEASLARLLPDVALHAVPQITTPVALDAAADALAAFVEDRTAALKAAADTQAWEAQAHRHVWHPYTQHHTAAPPVPLVRAQGAFVETATGERLVDGASSWWVNLIGHGRPEIARAIARQQQTLDHVIFAGAVHEPGARLAERLAALSGLERVFYSDNGSTAVEVALKMAYQAFANRGETRRTLFLSLKGSYHGDTFGTMSIGHSGSFHGAFGPLLFETLAADPVTTHASTLCPRGGDALEERLDAMAALMERHSDCLAGVVVEPLLMGSAGMLVQPPAFVRGIAALCRRHGVPLILDEVFTGLGRIGARFAFLRAGVEPDLVAVAKGLTGGNLPLAATLAKESYFEAFLADDGSKALMHGHSYTANPITCAAALAALDVLDRDDIAGRSLALEERFNSWLAGEGSALGVENGRALGGVLAFELPGSGTCDYYHPAAAALPTAARRHGLFLRPLGNTVYFAPPPVIAGDDLERALAALKRTVADLRF